MAPHRLNLTFGLRTLLIAFTLVALILGWFADRSHRRQTAVATIRAAGGIVQSEYEGRRQLTLFLCPSPDGSYPPPVVRTWTERLLGDRLKRVTLRDQPLTDQLLAAIASLHELRELNLSGMNLGDDELALLRSLRRLESLNLSRCQVTDRTAEIVASFPALKSLELEDTNLTDVAISRLTKLQNLELLRIRGTRLTDRGIGQLRALVNLKHVEFGNTEQRPMLVTDECETELRRALPQCAVNGWTLAERAANPPEMAPE